MVFLPSRESGVSVLNQMKPLERKGNLRGVELESLINEIGNTKADILKLKDLVHKVGLPIPDDKARQFDTMLIWWKNWFGDEIESHVNESLYNKWQELADLRIANEKDTALGLAAGQPPSALQFIPKGSNIIKNFRDQRTTTWHPFRMTRKYLDLFLSNLTYDGITIGDIWALDRGGKDQSYVFTISGGGPYGGARQGPPDEIISISVSKENEVLLKPAVVQNPVVPSRAVDLIPFSNEMDIFFLFAGRVFHEITHSFSIGDEYGGEPELTKELMPSFDETSLNIQDRYSLVDDGDRILGNKIKWLWHRISKAGVLASTPFPIGIPIGIIDYQITLKPNHASLFDIGDIVRLRKRPLKQNAVVSEELMVKSKVHDLLIVRPLRIGGTALQSFEVDSSSTSPILFKPIRKEIGSGTTEDFLLVAPKVLQHINQTQGPLNVKTIGVGENPSRPCDPTDERLIYEFIQYPQSLPPELRRKTMSYSSRLVGLYESGGSYYCGVYHPTGSCMMRKNPETDKLTNEIISFKFCHVCRYILVDKIDPSMHGLIDADYAADYPL